MSQIASIAALMTVPGPSLPNATFNNAMTRGVAHPGKRKNSHKQFNRKSCPNCKATLGKSGVCRTRACNPAQ